MGEMKMDANWRKLYIFGAVAAVIMLVGAPLLKLCDNVPL
jgi:hypothetical protein